MQWYLKHCRRIAPYVKIYQKQIEYYNWTAYNILQNEIGLILPTFNNGNRKKRFIATILGTVASKIIGLAFEGISSFLHHKRRKALHKAVKDNSDTLMSLINTVHRMHNITTWKERLFVGKMNYWLKQELTHFSNEYSYSISTLLFLTTIKEKYVRMYERFIVELKSCSKAIRILSKGYLPISLIPPSKLETILQQVMVAFAKRNKNYDLVLN